MRNINVRKRTIYKYINYFSYFNVVLCGFETVGIIIFFLSWTFL